MWRGFVRHSGGDFPVWAKVRVIANITRVVAIANIPSGKPIQRNQVRLESCEDSLLDETTARNLDEVIGYLPKSVLRAELSDSQNAARSASRCCQRRTGGRSGVRRRCSSGGEGQGAVRRVQGIDDSDAQSFERQRFSRDGGGKEPGHGRGFGAMKKIAIALILCVRGCRRVLAAPKNNKKGSGQAAFGARQVYRAGFAAGNHNRALRFPPGRYGLPRHGFRIWRRINVRGASTTSSRSRFRKALRR